MPIEPQRTQRAAEEERGEAILCPDSLRPSAFSAVLFLLPPALVLLAAISPRACAQEFERNKVSQIEERFQRNIQPLLSQYCVRCHNADEMESGVRVDNLDGRLEGRRPFLWKTIREQLSEKTMPPEDEPQPSAEQRQLLSVWIDDAITLAKSRRQEKNGSVRRLTVAQYQNTLHDLLGLDDELTDVLPPDGVSKDGFLNNIQTLELSPLLVEAYFDIAEKALERCIVDEDQPPVIQNFRMDLGAAINPNPLPDKLILGASSHLLENQDFVVTELTPTKPFDFQPFRMQTRFRFIEGYQGNATVRGWREYDSIYHAVFACMRGNRGYPNGRAYQSVPAGLLLRPAIPSAELFQVESTYGPKANFKVSLRELPDRGNFRVTVTAARYDDGLLLDEKASSREEATDGAVTITNLDQTVTAQVQRAGVYQADVYLRAAEPAESDDESAGETKAKKKRKGNGKQNLSLILGDRHFDGRLTQPAFLVVRLPAGPLRASARYDGNQAIDRVVLTPVDDADPVARQFQVFQRRSPRVGVHVGLRRDCGSTLNPVGPPQPVRSTELGEYVFEGAIGNFPSPDIENNNVNYLAGLREIGVRSEYTDGRDMPRLLVRSIEFEGPLYETWPPKTHRNIFLEYERKDDLPQYAREIIRSFASRAFRRPITPGEETALMRVWETSYGEAGDFRRSVQDALLVVLTSPQFLFLIETSDTPEPEPLDSYELASKLSYFLWNSPPDTRLLELAANDSLYQSLDSEMDRMIGDPRFQRSIEEFVSQWLSLDKLDIVETSRELYPTLTRDTKKELREEPVQFVKFLIEHNLPLRNLVDSEFILANEVVASYYGLGSHTESGFEFVRVAHGSESLGGILSQAGILAGLSDGRHANPVKRGAWLARKIIAEPPDDPPPNVPALPEEEDSTLSLREKLERHRDQKGCAKCHAGIDPWGLPLEQFDAGGLFKQGQFVDSRSTLPDATEVADAKQLKEYLANERIDQVAFSFLYHLASYATGRTLTYNEIELLKREGIELKDDGYRLKEMIGLMVKSKLFLEK